MPRHLSLFFMDDGVVCARVCLAEEKSIDETNDRQLEVARETIGAEFQNDFLLDIDFLKSLTGKLKWIFLNIVWVGASMIPSFAKIMFKWMLVKASPAESRLELMRKVNSLITDLRDSGLPTWLSIAFGIRIACLLGPHAVPGIQDLPPFARACVLVAPTELYGLGLLQPCSWLYCPVKDSLSIFADLVDSAFKMRNVMAKVNKKANWKYMQAAVHNVVRFAAEAKEERPDSIVNPLSLGFDIPQYDGKAATAFIRKAFLKTNLAPAVRAALKSLEADEMMSSTSVNEERRWAGLASYSYNTAHSFLGSLFEAFVKGWLSKAMSSRLINDLLSYQARLLLEEKVCASAERMEKAAVVFWDLKNIVADDSFRMKYRLPREPLSKVIASAIEKGHGRTGLIDVPLTPPFSSFAVMDYGSSRAHATYLNFHIIGETDSFCLADTDGMSCGLMPSMLRKRGADDRRFPAALALAMKNGMALQACAMEKPEDTYPSRVSAKSWGVGELAKLLPSRMAVASVQQAGGPQSSSYLPNIRPNLDFGICMEISAALGSSSRHQIHDPECIYVVRQSIAAQMELGLAPRWSIRPDQTAWVAKKTVTSGLGEGYMEAMEKVEAYEGAGDIPVLSSAIRSFLNNE